MGNKQRALYDCPKYCLKRAFMVQRRGTQKSSMSWVRLGWESGEQAARVCRAEYRREESCTMREFQRSAEDLPWVFSRALISANIWGNYSRLEKELQKIMRSDSPRAHTGPEIVSVSTRWTGKTHNSWDKDQSNQKSLASSKKND